MSKYSHFEMCEKIFGQKYKWNEQERNYEPYSRTDMWNKMIEQQDKIADLEAKLAESEKKAYSRGHSQRDIANEIKLNALREDVANKEKRIVELKQQLAEKEKEIATLEVMLAENKNELKELQEFKVGDDEYDLTDTDARFSLQCDLLNTEQDKISFTIDELEKVKDYFIEGYAVCKNFSDFYWNFTEQIDNQIAELTHQHEDKGE